MSKIPAPAVEAGPEVPEVETEHLGFKVLNQGKQGPKKVKILPRPWPADNLPPACANLLSVASKPALLAAAGPNILVIASTDSVRSAFQNKTIADDIANADDPRLEERDIDVVADFTPDITISTPNLRHVAFSADGDFLVTSDEADGGVAAYNVASVVSQGKKDADTKLATDAPVRALLPNPSPEFEQYFAIVLDNGKLEICDVEKGVKKTIREAHVNCAAWSARGKAVVSGSIDGTCAIHMTAGDLRGIVPRPPDVDENYEVTGVSWLKTEEFLAVYSLKDQDQDNPEQKKYSVIKSAKGWGSFTYHSFVWDPLPEAFEAPRRQLPARISSTRLQNWKPDLDDMLIITSSHADSIAILASTSNKISPDQETCNELMMVNVDDTKKAQVPRTAYGDEEMDSVFIGEALDLSSKEKILRPIPALEEINEAPWPLPAYMALTHEGLLAAWWVMWNKSIEAGERYPGLIFKSEATQHAPSSTPRASTPASKLPVATSTPFSKSMGTPGTPGTAGIPHFGNAGNGFGTPTPALMKPQPPGFGTPGFGTAATNLPAPTFGKPAQPSFGAPSTIGKPPQPAFGAPSAIGTPAKPAFGAPSAVGAGSGFGAVGGMGGKASPWGATSQTSESKSNPFSAAAGGSSGFAQFKSAGGSNSFSSFGSNNSAQAGSGFGALGQGQQKSGFGGLKTEPSFGSTVTVGSGTGSSLPSWATTPAQQSSSIFGQQDKSSFNTASFESKDSDASEANDRKRDEATPTPQAQPSQGLFGLAGGFKLGTTFASDGTAKDDPAKPAAPANGSFFGSDFSNMLGKTGMKPPATPASENPPSWVSTTPASPPKQKSLFPSDTPARESATPKAAPPVQEPATPVDDAPLPPDFTKAKPAKTEDAPLPPDFINTKLPNSTSDDLPPLAGSPGVEVEAPSSSGDVSPIDNEDEEEHDHDHDDESEEDDDEEGFSDEEDDEEVEEVDDTYPPNKTTKPQAAKAGTWSFQDSVNQSRQFFPPAPTPPTVKSGATSQSGSSASPAQPSLFAQASKPAANQPSFSGSSLFGQQPNKGPFSGKPDQSSMPAKPNFPPPTNRAQDLRSPSPARSSSASRLRREPLVAPGASLSSSMQGSKPPTPQPQVSDLEDEEDERIRAQLAQPIEPSRNLEEFVAYQNYTGGKSPSKTGHAAQIELIYKDINGMVDALGWNARSIKSFTQYHLQPQTGHQIDRRMLDDVQDQGPHGSWFENFTLCEIQALRSLEDQLEQELDAGRVQDVLLKLTQLARLLHDKAKLMTRLNDIRRQIINRKDPEKTEALRKAPLPKELADGQKALRNDYAQLLTSLRKAEDAVAVLRSRLVSHNAQNGSTKSVPSMEAVKKTVLRLANLAEQKNNDILVLEAQLRKIGLADSSRPSSSSSRNAGTPRRSRGTDLRRSIADTPYATPPTNRNKMTLTDLSRRALTPEVESTPTPSKGYGLFYTPEGSPTSGKEIARLSDLVDDNIDSLRQTARTRKQVAKGLKNALLDRGIKVTKVVRTEMAPALPTQDYYVTLGVRPSALYGEIKTSYRRLALLHHPDKNIGSQHATATIQLINAAWEVLKDATKRSEYDRNRQQRTASSSGSQPYAPSPATSQPNPQPHPQNETPAQREARAQAESNRIRQEWLNYERSQKEQIRQCRNTVKSLEAELECLNRNVFENRAKLANDNQSEAGTLAFLSNRLSEQEKSDITLATINAENAIRIKQIRLDEARVRLEQLNDDLTKRKNQERERLVAELAEKARKERLAKEKAEQARQWEQTRQAWEAEQRAEKESRKARKKAKREAEQKARQAAEQKAGWEAAKKAAREAEEYAREEAEYWATQKEERRMREEAEYWARKEAEEYARQEEKYRAREEAERRTREQAELRARRKAEHRARQEAAHRARQEESRKRAAKEHAAKQYEATAAERSRARRSNYDGTAQG
ncbi:uncharacterized protein J4E78_002446 [Alternaria triticimaculans]|uniref:uncharacterized protein n=1 Tax=Alternaria triticimaculans TaxID=297637 RepID=UPI0020C50EEA|nr:uncharacterized protein J4E78_002446 [Alternaria triticimaculans]KAI4668619.1 hypothetical protein J4E78_002446 [Alternaria triticimaculans]